MTAYRISVGNSTTGPVGFVARVIAPNKVAALAMIQANLPEYFTVFGDGPASTFHGKTMAHLNVYFNPDALTLKDVEEDI